jgi:hypothetical protein
VTVNGWSQADLAVLNHRARGHLASISPASSTSSDGLRAHLRSMNSRDNREYNYREIAFPTMVRKLEGSVARGPNLV